MTCRHFTVTFRENDDVEYHFFRHHHEYMLSKYTIDWPAAQVEILGGQCLDDHNYRTTTLPNGHLVLEWDRIPESTTKLGRGVHYVKKNFLTSILWPAPRWQYHEDFRIKPDFSLWLHSPYERLSAVRNESTAIFYPNTDQPISYPPRKLSERVFRVPGTLRVRWVLELLDTP